MRRAQLNVIVTLFFLFQLLVILVPVYPDSPYSVSPPKKDMGISQTYVDHDVIAIDGNNDLLSQAAGEGWEGTGTEADPIVISGYRIVDNRHMFRIINTNLFFEFRDNLLDGINGDWCGLYLANVTNGNVSNNIVRNSAIALHMLQIYNCTLESNVLYDNYYDGIVLELPCIGNNVVQNHIYDNAECGIILDYGCQDNNITNNHIHDNLGTGIYLWQFFSEPLITNNRVTGNVIERQPVGISLQGYRNVISNNTISYSGRTGILCNGEENRIVDNVVQHGNRDGISLYSYAKNNTVLFNTIGNNTLAGLEIDRRSSDNYISRNDFLDNNHTLQACDDGDGNTFIQNYYSNWNAPDHDGDDFVDYAYPVFGNANNTDVMPMITPNCNVSEWYTYYEAPASIPDSNMDNVLLFFLPVSGIILLIAIGVLFPKHRR